VNHLFDQGIGLPVKVFCAQADYTGLQAALADGTILHLH